MLIMGRKPKPRKTKLGKMLTALREANDWTQAEAALRLGVSWRTWAAWEGGTRTPGKFTKLEISRIFGLPKIS